MCWFKIVVGVSAAPGYRDNVVGGDIAFVSKRLEAEPARDLLSPGAIDHPLLVALIFRIGVVSVRHRFSICLLAIQNSMPSLAAWIRSFPESIEARG